MTNDLADAVDNLVDALDDYGIKVLTEKPEKTGDDYLDDDYGLAKILAGGGFAEARPIDTIPDGAVAGLISPVIDHLFNKQRVVLIKANEYIIAKNPCPDRDGGGISGISDDAIWCDKNGVAHVLITWPEKIDLDDEESVSKALEVKGVESLGNFDVNIELIRAAADRSQADRGYHPEPDVQYIKDVLLSGDMSPDKLVSFTIPVCDIRDLDWSGIECKDNRDMPADLVSLFLFPPPFPLARFEK